MSRPIPLHGRLEDTMTNYARWRRRALADGQIDERETFELIERIVTPALTDIRLLVRTQRFVGCLTSGSEGINSVAVERMWDEHQAERAWTAREKEDDTDPLQAA